MWGAADKPPETMEGGPPDPVLHAKDTCEQNKNQLETLKEIMLKNKQSLKEKEEEVQEYARRLSSIKHRVILTATRRVKREPSYSNDDYHETKSANAKSSLLQRKLMENRKAFEQRNKKITENKRAVEEKVEAIRQQLEEKNLTPVKVQNDQLVTPVKTEIIKSEEGEQKNKIEELHNKIVGLEATIIDLQENLKEKDSVIDSKTKAITLMSADLSKKGKTTLDTLEDTKDEMRTMQEHFVLMETSLKNKNENLLEQLSERDNRISELNDIIKRREDELTEQKLTEMVHADKSRSAIDTLADAKDAMKSMQENFILIESSLKLKNDNLLQQLLDYEIKLAEANEKIFQLESGTGITKTSLSEDIQYKLNKLEESNKQLQDEKYELQKSIADIQNTIIVSKSDHGSSILMEKDNRIAELEESIEKLKRTNKLAEEECTAELQKQIANLSLKNEEYSNKISDLEKLVQDLGIEKDANITRVSKNITTLHEDEKILQLTKELDDLNKSTIKMKAQHKSKIKNLQKQLESFKMVSDTNAELVRLGNQVTLLEEEKASAGDWQERIVDLESKVSIQRKEIQMHINATSTLENEKLDFMQELYTLKQQVSTLEAKVIESENLRVTAEMKVVDLEEQLDSISKLKMDENKLESLNNVSQVELVQKLETLIQENSVLSSKLAKLEDKGTSDTGSTESFETIQDGDKSELLKKIEYLTQQNNDLTLKLTKLEEKSNSRAGSTESFETIHDMDKSELLKKVEQLTQENNDLTMKLNRNDEKGSSDAGSTESFERISENNENTLKIEHLMQENSDLLIKINKLEEKLVLLESDDLEKSIPSVTLKLTEDVHNDISESQSDILCQKDDTLVEMTNLKIQLTEITDENTNLQKQIDALTTENNDIALRYSKLQEHLNQIKGKRFDIREDEKTDLQKEIITLQESQLRQSSDNITLCEIETDDKKLRMSTLLEENAEIAVKVKELEELNQNLTDNLDKITQEKNELREKIDQIMTDSFAKERLELINKLEKLNQEKESVAQERQELHEEISTLLHKSAEEPADIQKTNDPILQIESSIVASLEQEIKECKHLIAEQTNIIEEMKLKLAAKEEELDLKRKQIAEYEASGIEIQTLQNELKDMQHTIEEWKFKCTQMEEKMQELEAGKASIENSFKLLQEENAHLFEDIDQKETEKNSLKEDLESIITSLESKLQEELVIVSKKDDEIINIKSIIDNKEQELQNMHITLTDKMAFINILQEEVTVCKAELQRKDSTISSLTKEVEQLNDTVQLKEDEIYSLKKENTDYHEKLNESVSSKEYNKLLEELRDNEMLVNTMQNKIDERMKERNDLLGQIESISQTNTDMQLQLDHKNEEFNEAVASKENLLLQITEMEKAKSETEKRLWDLQNIWENNTKYVDDLQSELKNVYKTMEQLKSKHVEDTKMYDRRVEYVIEELNLKRQENEVLNMNLQEQEKVINQSFPEEIKVMLETKNADLEQKLTESENKIQTQLEKMKKIAANLKKKTALCQELEKRVVELEEKWTTEKDEKEAKNKKNQEIENSMREKDNKIADLEGKLAQAKNEIAEALDQSAKLTNEVVTSKDKMALMMEQITEMGEEIERCHADIEKHLNELAAEKAIKEDILTEYKSYKKETILKSEQQQLILDEVKEEARELSVRMQVMEAEYVEQLALIQNLQAENGLLSSKQIQINEKLENVEKESEERRLLIEQLQIEKAKTTNATTQTSEEDLRHIRISGAEHYDHCEQCRTVIEACEVRLLQREAEIDNLNNELSNSIANFVQMSNSMRVNDIINDLTEKARNADALYTDLMKNYDERGQQIQALQQDSQIIREEAKQSIDALKAQISLLESEKHDLKEKWNASQHLYENLQQEVSSLVRERSVNLDEIKSLETKLEAYKQKIVDTAGNKEDLLGNVSKNMDNFESDASNEKYGSLELFNASKIFGDSFNVSSREQNEVVKLRSLLDDKEIQCAALKQEVNVLQAQIVEERSILAEYNHGAQNLNLLQEQAEKKVEGLDHSIVEGTQLLDQRQNLDDKLKELTLIKDGEIQDLKKELDFMKSSMEILIKERDEYKHLSNSYKSKDNDDLQKEIRSSDDVDMLEDLEDRISRITKERNILQLQVNDLTRSLEETTTSLEGQRNAQIEMERMQRERDEAKQEIINLTRALEDYRSDITSAKNNVVSQNSMESSTSADDVILHESVQSAAIAMPVEQNVLPQTVFLEPGSTWDSDSNEKLNVDEETWGWNEADAQLVGDSHFTPVKIIPTEEVQLRTRVDELQDQIKDLESEKIKMIEENKVMQIRSGKIIKKLKEYKVQIENLQKQLNIQKSTSGFCELDSAIEEELKSQINGLEKTLNETNEELKNVVAEKDALSKRLDVLVTANERYMELKERQDMDMEILRIQNKELLNKVQSIEWQLQEYQSNSEIDSSSTNADHVKPLSSETTQTIVQTDTSKVHSDEDLQVLCNKYKEEVEDLKDEMEALATENEQLQHYLEEQKITISNLKVKAATDMNDFVQNQGEIDKKNIELQNKLEKSEKEYEQLRKQFEQCLMDANDQVSTMRQNNDALKAEISEKADKLETEIKTLRQQTETSELTANELRKQLENVIQEKEILEKTAVAAHSTEEKLSAITVSLGDVTELLNARVQEVADLKQELQKQYVDRQTAEAKLQDTIQMLTREMNEKKEELDKLREAFSNKEDELAQQKSMVTLNNIVSEATHELVQKHAMEIEEKQKEVCNLEEQLVTLKSALEKSSLELEKHVININAKEQELAEKDLLLKSANSELIVIKDEMLKKQTILDHYDKNIQKHDEEIQNKSSEIISLQSYLNESILTLKQLQEQISRFHDLETDNENLKTTLSIKESILSKLEEELREYNVHLQNKTQEINNLHVELQQINVLKNNLQRNTEEIFLLTSELDVSHKMLEETRNILQEKESLLEITNQKLNEKQEELNNLTVAMSHSDERPWNSNTVDGLPLFKMDNDNGDDTRNTLNELRRQMVEKEKEIEHLKYVLHENTYPRIIQEMQDRIDCLYDEKANLETSLREVTQTLEQKQSQLDLQMQLDRQKLLDQEAIIAKLKNELQTKEREMYELKSTIAKQNTQLSHHTINKFQPDDYKLHETIRRLTNELQDKEQEVEYAKAHNNELQNEILQFNSAVQKEVERISQENKDAIQQLQSEKEEIQVRAEQFVGEKLKEKEMEIDGIKQKLSIENENLLRDLQLRDKDIHNLQMQLRDSLVEWDAKLRQKEDQLTRVSTDLAEKEKRLNELYVTKEAELNNLKVQIHDKDIRIEELLALSAEEEKQLAELKQFLEVREAEINSLNNQLEIKIKEYELMQRALQKDIPIIERQTIQDSETSPTIENKELHSSELDLALYMLHQRDVRCEELTHELMQLLEERDTLQLRLSNAIRINEELRKTAASESIPKDIPSSLEENQSPLVEHPSPSKSDGPVEIAKEAIDSPIEEDKEALTLKLSQLHTLGHTKDVRLRDERELRHTQQMSLLAHKDVLSTLPPEAAARLVNANYTLSRDVQSQSSVLLNWLWGKSTPKVVHM